MARMVRLICTMKTRTTTLMVVTIMALSTMIADAKEEKVGWFRRTFCALTWNEIQTVVKTPREICSAVRHHVRCKEDLGDEWATGKETWERKTGDCEDYAACVVDLCKAAGIEANIQIFYPKGSWEAHAVAVGSLNGQLWISSNGWYETVKSVDDAKRIIAREVGWRHREILIASQEEVKNGSLALSSAVR